jgi:IclR family acetate operon transcriptional repressor
VSERTVDAVPERRARPGGVQSIERAFAVLEVMADLGGVAGLSRLAEASGLPLPTIHRLVRTLVDTGYLRPHLVRLVTDLGESANLAMLDGDQVVYVAQAPSAHSMRMFTEVGRRVLPHCTAVGKAMLAEMPADQVSELLDRTGMPGYTPQTITERDTFFEALTKISEQGYAIDESEQEMGVRCVALTVPGGPARLAISLSGPAVRMTEDLVERAVPLIREAGAALARDLS